MTVAQWTDIIQSLSIIFLVVATYFNTSTIRRLTGYKKRVR